ncbi:MAG TPA: ABC transporter permease subunit [Armatimonadota bacterium]|jgi:raffinose/stachyose/melibiose transport system permease protein
MKKRSSLIGYLLTLPALAVFVFYVAYPLVYTVVLSAYSWSPVNPVKLWRGLGNYADLLADPNFYVALRNNAYFVLLSLAVQLPLALLLAVALGSAARRHRLLRTVFFSPFVLPIVAVGLVWQLIYDPNLGALNALLKAVGHSGWALGWLGEETPAIFAIIAVSCWRFVGFHMMILLAGLQAIPEELYEAARLDGAGRWSLFVHITLPALRRLLLVDALLITAGAVKIFDLVQVMTGGGPGYSSDVLATYMYRSAFTNDRMGYAAALAVVMLLVTLGLTVAYQRVSGQGGTESRPLNLRAWLAAAVAFAVLGLGGGALLLRPVAWAGETLLALGGCAVALLVLWPGAALVSRLWDYLPRRAGDNLRDGLLALVGVGFFLPLVWSLVSSVKPQNELLLAPWALPKEWAWGNFAAALHGGIGLYFANSVGLTTAAVLLMLALSLPAAYALGRLRLRGEALLLGLILGGLLVPVHAALIPLYQINHALHLHGYLAVLGPYVAFCLPLSVLLLRAYFQELPAELIEAARLDGAGHLRLLWSILLPVARPALATVAIFQASWVWNELPLAMVFLTQKANMTLTVGLLTFRGEHSTDWAIVMAGVVMAMVPVLVLYFLFQRHVVKGLTAGTIK